MPKDLNILITGASRGIGNAIAKKISSRANKLFLTSKYSVTIDKAVDELKTFFNGDIYCFNVDQADSANAADKFGDWLRKNTDYLDAVILCAGDFVEGKLQEVEKNNGLKLTGITIPNGDQRIVPTVYLDSLYQEYIHGKDVDSCVSDVADMRIEAQGKAEFFDMGVTDILDYEKMKDKLQMRICDKEWNTDLLADKVVTEHGDFAAYYAVNLEENGEGISSIPVTVSLMNEWGVSAEQIQADAMVADRKRGVTLMDMNEIIKSMIFGEEPENLLNEKMDMEAMENPMFCLTNKAKMNGASLLLQEDIRKQIGECLGSDYFVIPSSIHEVLILPDNGIFQVPELNAMVQEVNETKVERQEQLSDKVQFCDGKTAVMENAERREARLEKEKAAEKAEVKGGIHGRLEKAKAEIKAKEGDKVPKNKSKELATAL